MSRILLFNKPYRVLCQFSPAIGKQTLADFIKVPRVYAAGRLDFDSEGLVILTDDGRLQARITEPRHKQPKHYLVQVENIPNIHNLKHLAEGIPLKDGKTSPAKVRIIDEPKWLWPRTPPIRQRQNIPTQWLELEIREGRNRQVRRMTAAIGHPTLRLVRKRVANWDIGDLQPGEWREV